MPTVRARSAFFAGHRRVAAGDLFDSQDPIVKGREALFEPHTEHIRDSRVEEATANPGVKRRTRRRRSAKRSADDQATVPDGTVDDVTAWVGDDLDRARLARAAEMARPEDDQRTGVLDHVDAVLEPVTVPDGTVDDVTAWVGDDLDRARLALDAELARPEDNRRVGVLNHVQPLLAD